VPSADNTVALHEAVSTPKSDPPRYELRQTLRFASAPQALVFLPDESQLVVSRRPDNNLHVFPLPRAAEPLPANFQADLVNLNEPQRRPHLFQHVRVLRASLPNAASSMAMSMHPLGKHLCLQTDTALARCVRLLRSR